MLKTQTDPTQTHGFTGWRKPMQRILSLTFIILLVSSPSLANISDGLVAYYPFNGNANDVSIYENHGNVFGPLLNTDRYGNARSYSFNGITDFIEVENDSSLNIRDSISLVAWVYPTSLKTQTIIRKGAGSLPSYELALSATGNILFSATINSEFIQLQKQGYTLNRWTYVVGIYDGANLKLYIDGSIGDQEEVSGTINTNDASLLIGTRLGTAANTFSGKIDDLRVYQRAISENEIESLFKENIEQFRGRISIINYLNHSRMNSQVIISPYDIESDQGPNENSTYCGNSAVDYQNASAFTISLKPELMLF